MKIDTRKLSELKSDPTNARKHDQKNLDAIKASLETFGQRKPIVITAEGVILAGNGTAEAAKALGWETIDVVETPEDWNGATAKAYAIADNRSAELAEWDNDVLASQLVELEEQGWELGDLGFTKTDQSELDTDAWTEQEQTPADDDSIYTAAINVPQYEIVGEKPTEAELYNREKTTTLLDRINKAGLDEDLRTFLTAAAQRHTVFNYRKIAEYYPHASAEVQQLFEDSALVVIDAQDAMRQGFLNFQVAVTEQEAIDREAQ